MKKWIPIVYCRLPIRITNLKNDLLIRFKVSKISTKLGDWQTLTVAQAGSFLIFRTDQRKAVKTSRTLGFMMLVDIYHADDSKNAVSGKEFGEILFICRR